MSDSMTDKEVYELSKLLAERMEDPYEVSDGIPMLWHWTIDGGTNPDGDPCPAWTPAPIDHRFATGVMAWITRHPSKYWVNVFPVDDMLMVAIDDGVKEMASAVAEPYALALCLAAKQLIDKEMACQD